MQHLVLVIIIYFNYFRLFRQFKIQKQKCALVWYKPFEQSTCTSCNTIYFSYSLCWDSLSNDRESLKITATGSCLLYGNRCCCNKVDQLILSRQLSTKVLDTEINDRYDLRQIWPPTDSIIMVIGHLHHYKMSTVFSNTSTDTLTILQKSISNFIDILFIQFLVLISPTLLISYNIWNSKAQNNQIIIKEVSFSHFKDHSMFKIFVIMNCFCKK